MRDAIRWFKCKLKPPKNQNNEMVSEDQSILDVCTDFYENIFCDKRIQEIDDAVTEASFDSAEGNDSDMPYAFLPDESLLKINNHEKQLLDEDITFKDMRSSVLKMKKDKLPGLDGLTVEFYQEFFDVIGEHLHSSFLYAFHHGELSISQKRGIIKLIPKKNKDPTIVKHLRPITLLNVDVKILSRTLAVRLQSVITSIVSKDQMAFIKGRNIGENILDVYSLIAAAEENDEADILIFLDIEKAYDTLNWRFLSTVLHKLDFPDSFIRWVEILHKNKEIQFFNNGFSSKPVHPNKGLAQGCGLSPLLFIIAMSRLSERLTRNESIEGITCGENEKKCCLAADDMVTASRVTEHNLSEIVNTLEEFYVNSGLKVNYNKSIIVRIGVIAMMC